MRRRVALLLACATAVALPAVAGASIAGPSPVVATKAYEEGPAADVGWLVWTQETAKASIVWARPSGGTKVRITPRGTVPLTSAGGLDGTTLVYTTRPVGGNGNDNDLKLYDLVTKTRTSLPGIVNSHGWECCASISGDWIQFMRIVYPGPRRTVFLYNRTTGELRPLGQARAPVRVQKGSVSGNWAVWIKCTRNTLCSTFRYDIAAKTTTKIPNPRSRAQYAASVTDDGTVYFAESKNIFCGDDFGIWRYLPGGPRQRLITMRRGRDIAETNPVVNADSSVSVFYDREACRPGTSDIYKFTIRP